MFGFLSTFVRFVACEESYLCLLVRVWSLWKQTEKDADEELVLSGGSEIDIFISSVVSSGSAIRTTTRGSCADRFLAGCSKRPPLRTSCLSVAVHVGSGTASPSRQLWFALVCTVAATDGDKTLMPVSCRLPVPAAFVTDHPLPSCS